jgi:tetratricopeptide (TPR) repeat protein
MPERMDLHTILSLAQSALDMGQIPAACEFYEVGLAQYPNSAEIFEAYAEIMMHFVQDADRARQMLQHAINVCPNEGHVKYLNMAQLVTGREALDCYRRAYEILVNELGRARKKKQQKVIRRTIASVRCGAAELFLTDLCDEPEAEQECETNVNDANFYCDDSVEVHQLRGSLRLSQQRNEEALESLRRAVELTHSLGEEYQPTLNSKVELGKLLMQVDATDAFRFLLEVLQFDDTNAYVWFLLGESARLRKRYHDAARLLKHSRIRAAAMRDSAEALADIDKAILVLVEEMGGTEAVMTIPNMDHPNPIALLEPEEDGDDEDEKEAEWEPASDDDNDA